jgi:Lecithin:cholesterol acyltransferase
MTSKPPMRDLIVILPGILGSVLQKDGRDLWAVTGQAIWNILRTGGNAVGDLKVQQDDPDAENLDDGIRATRLVENVSIIPGLMKIDGYTDATRTIVNNFSNVIQGDIYNDPDDRAANFYHFPYDWRRDNQVAAKILKRLLDRRLKCWREHSGNPNAKVILLAHSMGGLISRYYLEVLGGWTDCKALFTFGTPYRGSVKAVDFLANGYKEAFIDLTQVLRSMTSVYQLLPRYKALKIGNEFYRIAESPVDLPNIDRAKAQAALNFYNTIDDAADVNQHNPTYRRSFVTCPIVGVIQPTQQSAELIDGRLTTSGILPTWLLDRPNVSDGDGTVPQVSATPVQMGDLEMLSMVDYIAESHGALQNQPNTLENLLKRIQSAQTASLEDVRGGVEGVGSRGIRGLKGIGLALDDLYRIDEPITMRAKISGSPAVNALTAEITCVSEQRPAIDRNFTLEDGTWVMATDNLAAGVYRVTVTTDNPSEDAPNPVHNLFTVADLGA